jgi:hypothetical protein
MTLLNLGFMVSSFHIQRLLPPRSPVFAGALLPLLPLLPPLGADDGADEPPL